MPHHVLVFQVLGGAVGKINVLRLDVLFRDQHGDAGPLGIVVLLGYVQHFGPDDVGHLGQDLGQPGRIVLLVDVLDVFFPVLLVLGVANVVHVKAQGLGQVVEPVKL